MENKSKRMFDIDPEANPHLAEKHKLPYYRKYASSKSGFPAQFLVIWARDFNFDLPEISEATLDRIKKLEFPGVDPNDVVMRRDQTRNALVIGRRDDSLEDTKNEQARCFLFNK